MKSDFLKIKNIIFLIIIILGAVLRLIWLDKFPPSLYADEASLGYNAYSLWKTGKDEHGIFLPVSLRGYGDWKPALEAYLTIPFIALLGLNEYSVRLPSAILGTISIALIYFFTILLFSQEKNKEKYGLLTAFFLAISPWHLHQSRAALLLVTGLFFLLLGLFLFLKSLKRKKLLIFSLISFELSLYVYHSLRLITPIVCLFLFIKFFKNIIRDKRIFVISFIFGFIFILPFMISLFREPNVIFGRVKTISVFYSKDVFLKIWELQTQDGVEGIRPKFSLFFHNKPYLYCLSIIKRFFSHFEPIFLFLQGSKASPFKIPNMGILYFTDLIFLTTGLFILLKKNDKNMFLILFLLIISVTPAALTYQTPAYNRAFNSVLPFMILIAYGVFEFTKFFMKRKLVYFLITILYIFNFSYYLKNYYIVLPKDYAYDWEYGFKELNFFLSENQDKFSKIIFLPKTGMSYIHLLFYNQYPPEKYQFEANYDYNPDELGFEHLKSFNKYVFLSDEYTWEILKEKIKKGELYIGRELEIPKEQTKKEILYPNGKIAFRMTYLSF